HHRPAHPLPPTTPFPSYLGRATQPNTPMAPPPPETAAAFRDAIDHAITIARARLARNANDADAHFQLGAAVGLRASYTATVEGRDRKSTRLHSSHDQTS